MTPNRSLSDKIGTAASMTQEEFAAWVASRKDAGAAIDIETAELNGLWVPQSDPYAEWAPARECQDNEDIKPHYFVRGPDSGGWVWQGDLPDDKRAAMQARIDEHERKVREYYAHRKAAGRLIDIETCETTWRFADDLDPYGIELARYGQVGRNYFVSNKDSNDWVHVSDLPEDKRQALDERGERERLGRGRTIDKNIFMALFDELAPEGCDANHPS
jgi:hypothetical protein